jgi:F-type H+-transporting ATPase subunit a
VADPILHIKDGYYFEVPKFLWRQNYQSLEDVPAFLTKAHPEIKDVAEFRREMDGKILIPQPFGELKNLHDKESGFAISKFMIVEAVVALLLIVVFTRVAGWVSKGAAPRGRLWNLLESFLVFIRDGIARPAIGHHDADRFVPLLWTMFFFVLLCNLMGMVPWVGAPTASFSVTLAMAAITLGTGIVMGIAKFGPLGYLVNQVPHMEMDLPLVLKPLKYIIWGVLFVIETIGLGIKHGVLAVRLLANMVAGHLVILGLMGVIVSAASASAGTFALATSITVVGCTLFSLLELFVAFLQAYVFTFLSALFIGAAIHHH